MTQVGYAARTASGVTYVGNSRLGLTSMARWIRVEISHGGPLPTQFAAWPVSHMRPAYPARVHARSTRAEAVEARMEVARPWRHKLTSPTAIHLRYNVSQLVNKELVMAATSMVHVRVDEHIKAQATETLAAMGLSVSDAVRVFLTRVVAEQQLPFALKAPNADTRAAMEEARTISKARFASAKALILDLEKGAKR